MKKSITWTLLTAVLLTAAPLRAEEPGPRRNKENQERRMELLKERLQLSDEQAQKIRLIKERTAGQMKSLKESTRAEIDAILTPQQRDKFKTFREEFKTKKGAGFKDCAGCPMHKRE